MYYEEERTGSIHSVWELIAMARQERTPLQVLLGGHRPLSYHTVLLLEQAETIAARAAEEQKRGRDGLSP